MKAYNREARFPETDPAATRLAAMKIPHGAYVVVADGRKYLLMRNSGDEQIVNLIIEQHDEQDDPATRDIGSDEPGRTFTGTAGHGAGSPDHRSGYSQTDYHQQNEDNFAADAVKRLNRLVKARKIEALVVTAAPKTLGEMRKHYNKQLEAVLIGEVGKELTNRNTIEIAEALAAA